ncbi:urease accessory protein UreD [Leifsonia sp. A12D58]|uniref:urease accessory protein UreD n=1 Tax=Leifsonia sp. A12D58 TaxID=3397674 RepID=UPI0039E0D945
MTIEHEVINHVGSEPPEFAGGYRLQRAHFEPARVPDEVLRYDEAMGDLDVGSPGKVGIMQLEFAKGEHRTELAHHYQKSPLQIMRPLYYDELRPDMPYTFLMSTGGGVLQGDRLRTDLTFGPGSSAHVTTQAHTRIYKMERNYATAIVNLVVGAGAYVEYMPDPVIPFARSRYYQHTRVELDPTATLIVSETVYAGRLARDERHHYDVFASDFEVFRPDGSLVALDKVRLVPGDGGVEGLAMLDGRDVLSMLYVFTPLVPAQELADSLHELLAELTDTTAQDDPLFGVSVLPGDVGVWVRALGNDTIAMARRTAALWSFIHERVTGLAAPAIRKT